MENPFESCSDKPLDTQLATRGLWTTDVHANSNHAHTGHPGPLEPTRGHTKRRRWLQGAASSLLGIGIPKRLRCQAASRPAIASFTRPPIRSCIFVFYYGGPSHLDTYDMKPDAPSTVRGEFQPISSSLPGLPVCEHLPHMSRMMHKVALVRSMHHTNRLHDSASTESFTGLQGPQGDREEFEPIAQFHPCYGAVLSHLRSDDREAVPHATLPWLFKNVIVVPCQGGGFLGPEYDPFQISGDPQAVRYRAEILKRPTDLPLLRISQRRALLQTLDLSRGLKSASAGRQLDGLYERAIALLQSDSLRNALDIEQESRQTRERYGMGQVLRKPTDKAAALAGGRSLRGQNLLLARRLVEAGVPFVNVQDFRQQGQNWDSHADNFNQHRKFLLPQADQALSALIEDLDTRGLLESTLVVALGEFGRTPKINAQAGRDHWPDCYTILLAGGGVGGGRLYGASDRLGAFPAQDPVTPADLAATIYWRFGIDPATEIHDQTGRPYRLANGAPIAGIFS